MDHCNFTRTFIKDKHTTGTLSTARYKMDKSINGLEGHLAERSHARTRPSFNRRVEDLFILLSPASQPVELDGCQAKDTDHDDQGANDVVGGGDHT